MNGERSAILHYVGYDDDRGGIVSIVHALAAAGRFQCCLGLNSGGRQERRPALPQADFSRLDGEAMGPANFWRARQVAREVRAWLQAGPRRIFHGHSRAGLLAALWLQHWGERRVVASVHCYGSQRWFYRWAAGRLGQRLFWLSPAMRAYYGIPGAGWERCIPGGVARSTVTPSVPDGYTLRLGGIGAVVPWKSWELVIEAIALLPAALRARVTFEHIGAGAPPAVAALRTRAQAAAIADQVRFDGVEPGPERLLGQIDALVIASDREPFSMAMLEALAAGVPVIAADSGGATDVIQSGVNGELFATGEARSLADTLARWLDCRPALDRAKIRATTILAEDIAGRWEKVYSGLE